MIRRFISIMAVAIAAASFASAQTIYVTPANTQGFSTADTRPGGAVSFILDATAPGGGLGALQLTTNATNEAKAQFLRADSIPLSDVTDVSYYTKQNSASFAGGDPSFQLPVCLGGGSGTSCIGFTTLVFEPYQNGVVVPGIWQQWDVDAGLHWSSRTYSSGTCSVTAGAGGPPFYTLAGLAAACPNAVVQGYGVNIGTFNPSYNVEADLVSINGTTFDFEPYVIATNKDQCKNGGWMTYRRADGSPFRNQGDCIQYVNTGR